MVVLRRHVVRVGRRGRARERAADPAARGPDPAQPAAGSPSRVALYCVGVSAADDRTEHVEITDELARGPVDDRTQVLRIALDEPGRRNPLSLATMLELSAAFRAVDALPAARVIVLAGNGPAFSAGHDLGEIAGLERDAEYAELFDTCVELMRTIHTVAQPVIARVHGVATAAGCQLVAGCDLAVAADTARFATPGVNIGLFCSTPMVPLSRAVGAKRSMEMLLTGEMIDAATAREWGLVNEVVPEAELDDAIARLASRIGQASREVVALGKRAFWEQLQLGETDAYRLTAPVMVRNALLDDAREGIDAFLHKRPPRWA
jgi:enoyl-CoA hydratase/carnithine racemase